MALLNSNFNYLDSVIAILKRRSVVIATSAILLFGGVIWFEDVFTSGAFISAAGPRFGSVAGKPISTFDGKWNYHRDQDNLLLDLSQCETAFPGLFDEIKRPMKDRWNRRITLAELDSIELKNGYVRAMIFDQQLYIIQTQGKIFSREQATLHAIHRAILTSPQRLPNIEFAFNTDDRISSAALWAYARQEEDSSIWLMPDFGFWSWPEPKVGSVKEVQLKAIDIEENQGWTWEKKTPKLLWRGALMGLQVRERLLKLTSDKPWADVKALTWRNKESMKDLKSMSEHCQYRYLMHTEGNSYSGRLKHLQACESVVIVPKMDWIQHHHSLMKAGGNNQNYVEIDREMNTLEKTVLGLEADQQRAQNIAFNSRTTFRERFLTPAAETCYWRALFHGWAAVSDFEPQFFTFNGTQERVWRGLPAESFFLERKLEWDPY